MTSECLGLQRLCEEQKSRLPEMFRLLRYSTTRWRACEQGNRCKHKVGKSLGNNTDNDNGMVISDM